MGTTSIILRNLMPDTPYTVSVLPVYPAREGKRQSENGKTRESPFSVKLCFWIVAKFAGPPFIIRPLPATSASERSGRHEGERPDHHHAHRHLEPRRRQRAGLQGGLHSYRRRAGDRGEVLLFLD